MAFSKVTLNGTTLMDVTQDTVDESNLLLGETATKANGDRATGTYVPMEDVSLFKAQSLSASVKKLWGFEFVR